MTLLGIAGQTLAFFMIVTAPGIAAHDNPRGKRIIRCDFGADLVFGT